MNRYTDGWLDVNANVRTKLAPYDMDARPFNVGSIPAAVQPFVSVVERGDVIRQTIFTFSALPILMRATEQGGGAQIYTFPKGRILFLGGSGQINTTTTSIIANTLNDGKTCNWGVGTVTQANATLATTEQNLIQVAAWVSSAVINVAPALSTAGVGLAIVTPFTGVSTPTAAFLNLAVALATDIDADASTITSGTVTLSWMNLGLL